MTLPAGLTTRPLTLGDAAAVAAIMAAEELRDTGEVSIEEADLLADWRRPSFDLATRTLGVLDGDRLVAYAELVRAGPGARRRRPRPPRTRHRHPPRRLAAGPGAGGGRLGRRHARAAGLPGDRLLEALGFHVRWTSWVLALPDGVAIAAQPLPAGYVIREATGADHRAVWTVVEDAFLEWSVRDRQPFEDFAAQVLGRPGFAPWNLRVAVGPDGEVAGAVVVLLAGDVGYVDKVAVRRDRRGLGLARALLADAFTQARAHGATRSELSTDSRTGALGLYEKVGMEVRQVWVNRAIEVER